MTIPPSVARLAKCGGLLLALNALVLSGWVGCVSGEDGVGPIGSGDCRDVDGDGFGVGCAVGNDCDDGDPTLGNECYRCTGVPKAGCPCTSPGQRAECGEVTGQNGDQVSCSFGETECGLGVWGECVFDNALKPQGLGPPSSCPNNPCDPYCHQFPDSADPSLSNDAGIVGSNDGLTTDTDAGTTWNQAPNGPPPTSIVDTLEDAGAYPATPFYYHELEPGESASDPLELTASTSYIDVYFLVDTSATMGEALLALGNAMAGPSGVVQELKSTFPNARFGVGHFHSYQSAPHDISLTGAAVAPLWHTLNLQTSDVPARDVLLWLGSAGTTSNNNSTEGFGVALFAAGSDTGLSKGSGQYWVRPRNDGTWATDYGGSAAIPSQPVDCPDPAVSGGSGQGIAYPCFAPGSKPITIVMTDNPSENGPGGHFALGHASTGATFTGTGPVAGSTSWPAATSVDATQNGLEANAVAINPTTFQRYKGIFTANGSPSGGRLRANADSVDGTTYTVKGFAAATSNFPTSSQGNCDTTTGQGGREAFFEFTLTERSYVHFETWGSEGATYLYILDDSTRARVACSKQINWINTTALSITSAGMRWQNTIEARLAPGSYTLVLDQPGPTACPSGYTLGSNGTSCYKYSGLGTTATANGASCSGGGALASIDGPAEDAMLLAMYPNLASAKTIIGARRNSGYLTWDDGTGWSYTNWAAGNPTSATCARRQTGGKWESMSCTGAANTHPYLCELVLPPASPGYFLQVNAMPDTAPVALPTWQQMVDAQNAIGGKIIGIDVSGLGPINAAGTGFDTCDAPDGVASHAVDRWTYAHLQEAARATGSVSSLDANPNTNPFVFSMDKLGGPCHDATDPPIGTQVVSAVTSLTQTIREDISVVAFDSDDPSDFDYAGPPGAIPQLTPFEVDEGPQAGFPHGQFIGEVVAQPGFTNGINGSGDAAPGGLGLRCNDDPATTDVIEQCMPDTEVRFVVTFEVPPTFAKQPVAQIFTFDVQMLGSGSSVVGSKPAVIVVPPTSAPLWNEGLWWRDYDTSAVCPSGSAVVWGHWSWAVDTPTGSQVDFRISTAKTAAGLATAPQDALQFTNPPGPSALTGNPIGAKSGAPDTQGGATVVDTTLALNSRPRSAPFLRVYAHLKPTPDKLQKPTLVGWNLEISCPPSQ